VSRPEPIDIGALYLEHHADLFRYLCRLTGTPDLAADATQEAFIRLAVRAPEPRELRGWLFRVATNLARERARTRTRRRRLLDGAVHRAPIGEPAPAPDAALAAEERRRRVRAALQRLTERDRTILLMREEGFTHREIAEAVGGRRITLRTLDMRRYDEEARTVLDIYNEAWFENWGHVPMTEHEFQHLARALKQIVDPELVLILEDNGYPVGFSLLLPNLNQALRHARDGRLFPFGLIKILLAANLGAIYETRMPLMGIRKKYHGRGLDALLVLETIQRGKRRGYEACEMSWVLDTNKVLLNALEHLGGVVDKEYALFEKPL